MNAPALVRLACLLLAMLPVGSRAAEPIDRLTGVGSDTASALVARWAEAFRGRHPGVVIQVQAAGSASTPAALIEGAADFGSMSRPMSAAEVERFRARHGHAPTGVQVAHDAIAVFVHPDNPLQRVTLAQIDAIYSGDLRCGAAQPLRRWSDLGIATPGLADLRILASGRNEASGTSQVFRESALCGGRYRADMLAWPGNGAVVATVAANHEAIGYAGAGYVNARVKPLAVARDDDDAGVLPDRTSVEQGRYALSRTLYLYVNRPPRGRLARLPSDFLAFVLSDEGQSLAEREGFTPLQEKERVAQRALIE